MSESSEVLAKRRNEAKERIKKEYPLRVNSRKIKLHCELLADLELKRSAYLYLQSVEIKCVCYQTWLTET